MSTVARSNYDVVKSKGITIPKSKIKEGGVDNGGVVKFNQVFRAIDPVNTSFTPDEVSSPFSYIVVTTKALSYAKPTLVESLEPFVVPGKTTIALIQNGIGIEDAVQQRWPDNLIITCVVRITFEHILNQNL